MFDGVRKIRNSYQSGDLCDEKDEGFFQQSWESSMRKRGKLCEGMED